MMTFFHRARGLLLLGLIALCVSFVAVDFAEARRGGGFGSRGLRTFERPAPTRTQPNQTREIDRSMTPRQQTQSPTAQPASGQAAAGATAAGARGGMFGGMAGGLLGGLMLGGLIGMLMGTGLGGLAGFLGLILQVLLVVVVVALIMRFFRNRQQPAVAGSAPTPDAPNTLYEAPHAEPTTGGTSGAPASPTYGDAPSAAAEPADAPMGGADEIGLTGEDFDQFEQLLVEVQAAFSREDFAALRLKCTPEIVSFLSEELGENAVKGLRNDVLDVTLLQGDLAEAWREGDEEYATVAMRYSSVDVMRDRETGDIVEGVETPTETTEVWTFVRPVGGTWKLSAIQE